MSAMPHRHDDRSLRCQMESELNAARQLAELMEAYLKRVRLLYPELPKQANPDSRR